MRPPSENFRSSASTFHSMSVGGRLVGLLKYTSYSIFSRRNWVSRTLSSSSVVTKHLQVNSVVIRRGDGEVPSGHRRSWYESKGQLLASSCWLLRAQSGSGGEFA